MEWEGLSKRDLIRFIKAYDRYVIECSEDQFERCPVCIAEFFDCEWKEMEGNHD